MDLGLKGKVAVISGGTSGIGEATALRFLAEGCKVAVCGRVKERLDAAIAGAAGKGYELYGEIVDAADKEQVDAFAENVFKKFGSIDIWVNSAGGNKWGPVYDIPEKVFDDIVNLNLKTAFLGMQAAARYMIPNKKGAIVNISSLSSKQPVVYRTTYGAAKAAVNKLTIGMAAEVAPFGIRVNAVAPGIIDTRLSKKAIHEDTEYTMRMIPAARAGKPEEVGDVIVCLASDIFSYVTGTVIEVDGGKATVEDANLMYSKPWDDSMRNY